MKTATNIGQRRGSIAFAAATALLAAVAAVSAQAAAPAATVTVSPNQEVRAIKPMNGVNNGPSGSRGIAGARQLYAMAKIPFARVHDSNYFSGYGGPHSVDITSVFPNFDADENDPASYDFIMTDRYLSSITNAGTEVFYRLGQSIEHGVKKYGIMPPKDFAKWARICEHVIRHYNEGWGDGFFMNIRYWEIWNEPDLCGPEEGNTWKTNPLTWGGSEEDFHKFYIIAARHLKKCFPHLKIGGPALCGYETWAERFIKAMAAEKVPMDFFSWHAYRPSPEPIAASARNIRRMLDANGYKDAESILDEWNYIRSWTEDFAYNVRTVHSEKGAAFTLSTMIACQNAPVDILTYYNAQPGAYNGLFANATYDPLKGYYSFYAWSKLKSYGMQVAVKKENAKDLYACAAKKPDGSVAVIICRYDDNDNKNGIVPVRISTEGLRTNRISCHLTDRCRAYTEFPLTAVDGFVTVPLEQNSFALVEF